MTPIPQFIGGVLGGLNDTKKSLRVTLVDSAGAPVNLTDATIKLYSTGVSSGDRPSSLQATGCTFTTASAVIASGGSFAGVTAGTAVTCPSYIAAGTTVVTVTSPSQITLSAAPLSNSPTGGITLAFAVGITGTIVGTATDGVVDFPALGNITNIGTLSEDTYAYVVDVLDSGGKHSVTVPVSNFKVTRSPK